MTASPGTLYLGLYERPRSRPKMPGLEDRYHWALLIQPKAEGESNEALTKGWRCQAVDRLELNMVTKKFDYGWFFQDLEVSMLTTQLILVRVKIAEVVDSLRLRELFKTVLIPEGESDPDFNCVVWTREALQRAWADSSLVDTGGLTWETLKTRSLEYADRKVAEGFSSKEVREASIGVLPPPTLDLVTNEEIKV